MPKAAPSSASRCRTISAAHIRCPLNSRRGKQTGNFWIKPTALPLDVSRGPVGTTFRIHLKGVGWSETANIVHVVYDNSYIGYACAFNSQGDVETDHAGDRRARMAFHRSLSGHLQRHRDPAEQFPIPQLTYADDHPGEDLPAFRYAFEVTANGQIRAER